MAIQSGSIVKVSDVVDYINTNVVSKINGNIYWYKSKVPTGIDANLFSPDNTVPNLTTDADLNTGKIISAGGLSSSIEIMMTLWCEVRMTNYTRYSWGWNNGGTPPRYVSDQSSKYGHFAHGESNFLNRLPILKNIGASNKNKPISVNGFQQYVDTLYDFWKNAAAENIIYTDGCHGNCHGSCHGSKGW